MRSKEYFCTSVTPQDLHTGTFDFVMESKNAETVEIPSDTAVDAAVKNEHQSQAQSSASAQPAPESRTDEIPSHGVTPFDSTSLTEIDAWNGIEGQIALDSFLTGESERPLMELFARAEGINVNDLEQYSLRSSK